MPVLVVALLPPEASLQGVLPDTDTFHKRILCSPSQGEGSDMLHVARPHICHMPLEVSRRPG